jgi:L-phenylalanine/L-methionine N-acetyltransferase
MSTQSTRHIRKLASRDAAGIVRIMTSPGVYHGTLQLPYATIEDWEKKLAGGTAADHVLGVFVGEDMIAMGGVHGYPNHPRRQHAANLGLCVRDDWQRQGVGGELFDALVALADGWLNLWRLELTVFADNAHAIRLYENRGFTVEGHFRGYALRDGRWTDALSMARWKPGAPV